MFLVIPPSLSLLPNLIYTIEAEESDNHFVFVVGDPTVSLRSSDSHIEILHNEDYKYPDYKYLVPIFMATSDLSHSTVMRANLKESDH